MATASLYIPIRSSVLAQAMRYRFTTVKMCRPRAGWSVSAWPPWPTTSPGAMKVRPEWQSSSPSLVSAMAEIRKPSEIRRATSPASYVHRTGYVSP